MFASAVKKPDIFLMARIFNDYPFAKNRPIRTQNTGNHAKARIIAAAALTASPIQAKSSKNSIFRSHPIKPNL